MPASQIANVSDGQLQLKKEPRLPSLLTFIVCQKEDTCVDCHRNRRLLRKMLSRRHVREVREPHDLHRVVRLIAVWIYGVVTHTSYKCNNRHGRRDAHWSLSGQVGWYQNGMGATLFLGYVDDLERIGRAAFFCSPIWHRKCSA